MNYFIKYNLSYKQAYWHIVDSEFIMLHHWPIMVLIRDSKFDIEIHIFVNEEICKKKKPQRIKL